MAGDDATDTAAVELYGVGLVGLMTWTMSLARGPGGRVQDASMVPAISWPSRTTTSVDSAAGRRRGW